MSVSSDCAILGEHCFQNCSVVKVLSAAAVVPVCG